MTVKLWKQVMLGHTILSVKNNAYSPGTIICLEPREKRYTSIAICGQFEQWIKFTLIEIISCMRIIGGLSRDRAHPWINQV